MAVNKIITVKKKAVKRVPGGARDIKPLSKTRVKIWEHEQWGGLLGPDSNDNDPRDDPIDVKLVSLAVKTAAISRKFIECEVMSDNIVVPDVDCWFYIKVVYPWRIKSGKIDSDAILTDGESFYVASRDLANSPFILNDYSFGKLTEAIEKFVSAL